MKKIIIMSVIIAEMFGFGFDDYKAGGNFDIVSNYVFRGATQSNNMPAAQGTLNITYGSLYLGAFGSSANILDSTNKTATAEFDGNIGLMGPVFGGVGFNIGYIYYAFPDAWSLNSHEVYLGLRYLYGLTFSSGLVAFYDINANAMSNYELQTRYDFGPISFGIRGGVYVDKRYYGSVGLVTNVGDFDWGVTYRLAEDMADHARHEYVIFRVGKSI